MRRSLLVSLFNRQSELNLKIELVGEIRRSVAQSEQDAARGLPLRPAFGMGEFIIGDGTKPMLLVVERPGMGEILDLAKTLHAKAPPFVQLTLQLPIHFELQAVYLDMIAHLPDDDGVDVCG